MRHNKLEGVISKMNEIRSIDFSKKYKQIATKNEFMIFILTTLLAILFLILTIVQSIWYLLLILPISIFWGVYSNYKKIQYVEEIDTGIKLFVDNKEWKKYKKQK
jgi:fatty acid desaturase